MQSKDRWIAFIPHANNVNICDVIAQTAIDGLSACSRKRNHIIVIRTNDFVVAISHAEIVSDTRLFTTEVNLLTRISALVTPANTLRERVCWEFIITCKCVFNDVDHVLCCSERATVRQHANYRDHVDVFYEIHFDFDSVNPIDRRHALNLYHYAINFAESHISNTKRHGFLWHLVQHWEQLRHIFRLATH